MGINSVYYFTVNSGGINGESFTTYITELVSYIQADSTEPAYVFMDNAPIHKVSAVRSIFEANPSINFIFIPAYSPQLNPIGHLFAEWKAKVRHNAPTNESELSNSIHAAVLNISAQNCQNYYSKMESNIIRLIDGF